MSEVTNVVKVDDVMLSPECLARMRSLQNNKNENLMEEIDVLKDAIILLTLAEFHDDHRRKKKVMIMDSLAHMVELHEQLAG